jgi:DNA-binding response OmpR family regulator
MMPLLDGFGLLRELRADPTLRDVPVMLVSARAGEEARTEGITAGADDYLTKPFSAKELVARVEMILKLQRVRRESLEEIERSEDRFRTFVTATSDVIDRMSADWSEMYLCAARISLPTLRICQELSRTT